MKPPPDLAGALLAAEAGLRAVASDPIAHFRFSSKRQRDFCAALSRFDETALRAGNQAGKAQPVDEPVLTPDGWRRIGDLSVGAEVFARDGSVTKVTGVFPQGVKPIRRVLFGDGSWTMSTDDHLWVVKTPKQRFKGEPGETVMRLGDIVERWGEVPARPRAVSVPLTECVQYSRKHQPIAPYTMGALLGDGCFGKSSVAFSCDDPRVLERVTTEVAEHVSVRRTTENGCDYRLTTGMHGGVQNHVISSIRALGLDCLHAHEKFIPDCYLRGDKQQRLDLLRGLMDTDGWCSKSGASYFCTTSPRLRDGIVELVQSLGGVALVGKEKRPTYSYGGEKRRGRPCWNVLVRLHGERVFHLDRKADRAHDSFRTNDRVLESALPAGEAKCVCISVAHESQTYLTRSCIVTHNTTVAAYVFVAIARGCTEIDGEPLPLLGAPNTGAVLAKGRAMAKESVIKLYRQAVGAWPHHLEKNGNTIEAIWVKPNRSQSEDWRDWSCIRFFVEGGQSVAGMRLDWAHADEPPDWPMWLELRMRGKANRHFVRAITFTPIDKREWAPLREDFKGCERADGKDRKVMLTLSVYDNKALGKEHLKGIEAASKGLLQKAKLYGEWVDTTGANPFDQEGLRRWRAKCYPGTVERFTNSRGGALEWEWWEEPKEGESYFVVADPSAGIEDEAHDHDPAGIVVVSRNTPRVVARYNGYTPAYELGRLGAFLARRYNGAMLVWERNSGYGESFWLGTGEYGNVYIEHHRDTQKGNLSERIGWTTTATTRGTVIGALQKAILEDGLQIWSLEAVESLENVVLDRNGRIEAGAGSHDEDMIVLGLAAHLLETVPLYKPPPKKGSAWFMERFGLRPKVARKNDPFAAW